MPARPLEKPEKPDRSGLNSQTLTDPMHPFPAQALCRSLGLARPEPSAGDPLPPFWHWLYFLVAAPRDKLGIDGHLEGGHMSTPARALTHDAAPPRRMWAGGHLTVHGDILLGRSAAKTSTVASVAEKTGRSGPMTFVTVRHEISGTESGAETGPMVVEEQEIVYRGDPDPHAPAPTPRQAPSGETHTREWVCDPVLLFRYSALTFNGHRIHYDVDYATRVEGYPGLVVHGPLLATLLLELACETGPVREFSYRLTAPTFAGERFAVCAKDTTDGLALWVRRPDGGLAVEGTAKIGEPAKGSTR